MKTGTFKIFLLLFFSTITFNIFSFGNSPSAILAGYYNKVYDIVYSVGSDEQCGVTFLCQDTPVCIYTPLSYRDIAPTSLRKTYFLPHVNCSKSQIYYLFNDLKKSLNIFDIDLRVDEIEYGLQMDFILPDHDRYTLVKSVDSEKKTISFTILPKI